MSDLKPEWEKAIKEMRLARIAVALVWLEDYGKFDRETVEDEMRVAAVKYFKWFRQECGEPRGVYECPYCGNDCKNDSLYACNEYKTELAGLVKQQEVTA